MSIITNSKQIIYENINQGINVNTSVLELFVNFYFKGGKSILGQR